MAYDRKLADRIRTALAGQDVREVAMFGGLSFMVDGKLTVTANARGALMVRCDPTRADVLLERDGAQWAQMRGKRMSKGWIVVDAGSVASGEALAGWLREALDYTRAGSAAAGSGTASPE